MIPRKLFWSLISIYLILGFYFFYLSFQSPVVGIDLEKQGEKWIISNFEYPELGEVHHISQGDYILKVDNKNINQVKSLQYDQMIRSSKLLLVETKEGELREISVKHSNLPFQFFNYYILPICYFLIALVLAIYLYIHKKGNNLSLNILILFILTVAISYTSMVASSKFNRIGIIVNSTGMILSLVLLIHFLNSYFFFLNIKWTNFKTIKFLYFLPILIFILTLLEVPIPKLYSIDTIIILSLFCILITLVLVLLGISYLKYSKPQIKILFWGIILPFFPFVFLYVLPDLLFKQFIFSPATSSLFLLLIPFGFLFAQLTERLYDINYHISRFRYYLVYSLFLTFWIIIGTHLIITISIEKLLILTFFIFVSLIIFFYIKEKLDYFQRKVLFSPQGDYIHLLYSTIDEIGNTINMEELFHRLSIEVGKQLELDIVYVIEYDVQHKIVLPLKDQKLTLHKSLDKTIFENLQLREIKKVDSVYVACLHQNVELKQILILGNSRNTQLKYEELLWLELLILYVNNFIDNTKLVEDLLAELQQAQQKGDHHPLWLKKLVWLQLEDEKHQLAQELHDTILQEQIFLIREMDSILYETDSNSLHPKISDLHRQLVAINHQLRGYCEKLKPPLLDTLGLNAALNKLFMQTKQRAKFTLIHSIEPIETKNDEIPLLIYRIIQEMLSNALKHSQATYVKIQLTNKEDGFEIFYMDNGIGCDVEIIHQSETMGLTGMRERVLAYNGYINIDSYPNEGMQIHIQVSEGVIND